MSDLHTLTRPASLPDVRLDSASSPRTSLIATLEPFQSPRDGKKKSWKPSRPDGPRGSQQRARRLTQQIETLPGMYESNSYDKYMVVKALDGKAIKDLDIFEVHRSLIKACGREPKVIPQGDGSILVEVSSPEESFRLRSLTTVPGADVSCVPHATLNQTRGVVFSRDLLRYSEERLLKELEQSNVVSVRRVTRSIDGIPTPTPTLFLTFDQLTLPSTIKCAWLNLPVKPFIPNPRRCFHCQAYGHVTKTCRRLQNGLPGICARCGKDDHGEDCPGPVKCYHCGEPHPVSSKDCERYQIEKEILLVRNKEKISFPEAKRQVMNKFGARGRTFASFFKNAHAPSEPKFVPRPQQPVTTKNTESHLSHSHTPAMPKTVAIEELGSLEVVSVEPGSQKRTRSEDSLEGVPPAKIQSPAPTSGSTETLRESASEAAPTPVTPSPSGSATSGTKAGGSTVTSAAASSLSSAPSATTSGWKEVARGKKKKTVPGEKGHHPVTTSRCNSSLIRRPSNKTGKGQPLHKGSPTKQT